MGAKWPIVALIEKHAAWLARVFSPRRLYVGVAELKS